MDTSGKREYELHTSGGGTLTWAEVAETLGEENRNTVRKRAQRYRKRLEREGETPVGDEPPIIEERDGTRIERYRNRMILTTSEPVIKSLEDALEFAQVDLDVWEVDHYIVNPWTVAAKVEKKKLTWKDGQITEGHIESDGNLGYGQNIQVKVWLVRKKPLELHPVIKPITIGYKFKKPTPPKDRAFTRTLIWADPQFGFRRRVNDAKLTEFHDRACIDVILQIAAACEPDRIRVLGDWFDAAEWTDRFLRSPEYFFTFQPALLESHWWLTQFCGIAPVTMHQGNHDARLPNAIKKHLPFAYGLRKVTASLDAPAVLSIPNLMDFEGLGVEWIDEYPNDRAWLAPKLALEHGNIARGKTLSTANALARGNTSIIIAHNHRLEFATEIREFEGEHYTVSGVLCPCACRVDFIVPGHRHSQNWNQGALQVDVFESGEFAITPIQIESGRAVFDGKLFEARDRMAELREALPDWNW